MSTTIEESLLPRRIKFVPALLARNRTHSIIRPAKSAVKTKNPESPVPDSWLAWPPRVGTGAGLVNLGNTCFLNSVFQCISYIPPLTNAFLSKRHSKSCRSTGFCSMCVMERHVYDMFKRKNPVSPSRLVRNLRCIGKHFQIGRQQDAHEFLRLLVDSLEHSCREWKLIQSVFNGKLNSSVKCLQCGSSSDRIEEFQDISLDMSGVSTLDDAFKKFCTPDRLFGANQYNCSHCARKVNAKKQTLIMDSPLSLCIQLKRFRYDYSISKINTTLRFKSTLDIGPFMSTPCTAVYDLTGLLVHYGNSCTSGHYVSYVKTPSGKWALMDDESVQYVGLSSVLRQEPYMLFYTRRYVAKPVYKDRLNDPCMSTEIKPVHVATPSTQSYVKFVSVCKDTPSAEFIRRYPVDNCCSRKVIFLSTPQGRLPEPSSTPGTVASHSRIIPVGKRRKSMWDRDYDSAKLKKLKSSGISHTSTKYTSFGTAIQASR